MSHTGPKEPRLTQHSSILASLPDGVPDSDYQDAAIHAIERKQNFQSACTLKALSPIVEAIAFEQMLGMEDVEAASLCREIVMVCRKASSEVCLAMDLSEESKEWGRSYFAGVIATNISTVWPRLRKKALDINWAVSISELAKPLLGESIPPSWKSTELNVSINATMITAMQGVMDEYDTFNLFHRDKEAVEDLVSEMLMDAAFEQVERVCDEVSLSEDSKCSLAQTFIKNGGKILAKLWNSNARYAVDAYQNKMTKEQKHSVGKNGFPLEDLKSNFEKQMNRLGDVSLKTMLSVSEKYRRNQVVEQAMVGI